MIHQNTTKKLVVALSLAGILYTGGATAEEVWTASKVGVRDSQQIAVLDFVGNPSVSQIVKTDLDSRSLLNKSASTPQQTQDADSVLDNIHIWQNLGLAYVVLGKTHSIVGNKLAIRYDVVDIYQKKIISTQTQISDNHPDAISTASHRISEQIYQLIRGSSGDFVGRIAYVEESDASANKTSSLKLMDASGNQVRTLFRVQGSIMTPSFSYDGEKIAFVAQAKNALPVIYVQSINAPEQTAKLVTPFWGHNLAPAFSPDGTQLLFSGSHEANNPNVYRLDLATSALYRLTDLQGAENSPSYLNQKSFVFTADNNTRSQSLYRQDLQSRQNTRLIANASNPKVSRDGSKIAYVSGSQIVIANSHGTTLQRVVVNGHEISASFSPSANHLLYATTHANQSKLVIYSLTDQKSHILLSQGLIKDPVWSP